MGYSHSTILVVDDNPTNLKLVTDVLGFEGHSVVTAMNAKQAQVVVQESRPDLILMDIGLPDMDGLALTKILKNHKETRHIIVVALTAFAMKGDEGKAIAAGCDGYIIKPIDTRRFPAQVAELLRSHDPRTGRKSIELEQTSVDLRKLNEERECLEERLPTAPSDQRI